MIHHDLSKVLDSPCSTVQILQLDVWYSPSTSSNGFFGNQVSPAILINNMLPILSGALLEQFVKT